MSRSSRHYPPSGSSKASQRPAIRDSPVLRNKPKSIASEANVHDKRSKTAKGEAVKPTKPILSVRGHPIDKKFRVEKIVGRLSAAAQSSSDLTNNSSQQSEGSVQNQVASVNENSLQAVPQPPPVSVENLVRETNTQEKVAKASNKVQSNMDTTAPTIQKPSNEANQPVDKGTLLENNAKNASTDTRNPSTLTEKCSQQPNSSVKELVAPVTLNTSQVPSIPGKPIGKSGGAIAHKVRLQDNTKNANDKTQAIQNKTSTQQNNINKETAPQSLTKKTRSTNGHVSKQVITLPPKSNPNHSKSTLKYHKRARGLQELVQDTGIYVNAIELAHCRRSSDNCNTLARMLLTEVFSHNALTSCSLINVARDKVPDGNKLRHELDEFAIKVILKFVEDYGSENQWDKFDYKSVTKSMNYEISKIRAKYGK